MGSPKALLTLEGQTFLACVVGAFRAGGCDPTVVVTGPEEDEDAALIACAAREAGAAVATNPDRDTPQLDSVRAGLAVLPENVEGVLISPVDAPAVTADLVRSLIDAAALGAPVVLPSFRGRRGHPVLIGRTALQELAAGDLPRGARSLIQRYEGSLVEVAAGPEVLLDVDTPADYQALRERRT